MKKTKISPWGAVVKDFEGQLVADGLSENTRKAYLLTVRQFTDLHKDSVKVSDITQQSVNQFLSTFNPRKGMS
jgi:site-specific recombinase XerD